MGGKADSEMLEAALMGGLAAGAGVVLTEALRLPRPRKVSMIGSALVRVVAAAVAPVHYEIWIFVSGGLWTLAFVLYLGVYWPVLTGPRVASPSV